MKISLRKLSRILAIDRIVVAHARDVRKENFLESFPVYGKSEYLSIVSVLIINTAYIISLYCDIIVSGLVVVP